KGRLLTGTKRCQAEVEDLHLSLWCAHQIVRLDVAVDHALFVRVLQAERGLADDVAGFGHRQGVVAGEILLERFALRVFPCQEVPAADLPGIEGRDNIRSSES